MVPAVASTQGKKAKPRKVLKALFKTDAHIVVDRVKGLMKVQILGLDNNCADQTLKPFIDELSATETMEPRTNLNLVYELSTTA